MNKWDKLYITIAQETALLSTAERKKVGCVLVKNNNIIAFGYNGTPSGFDNTCEIDNTTKPEVIHAEINAVAKVAKSTNSSVDSVLYITMSPCVECAKLLIQSGIKKVYYQEIYRLNVGLTLLEKANIEVVQISPVPK